MARARTGHPAASASAGAAPQVGALALAADELIATHPGSGSWLPDRARFGLTTVPRRPPGPARRTAKCLAMRLQRLGPSRAFDSNALAARVGTVQPGGRKHRRHRPALASADHRSPPTSNPVASSCPANVDDRSNGNWAPAGGPI